MVHTDGDVQNNEYVWATLPIAATDTVIPSQSKTIFPCPRIQVKISEDGGRG